MTKAIKTELIPHVRYDENGNVVERYNVPVERFADDENIIITDDWIRHLATKGHKGDVSKADYTNIGKKVWYRTGGQPDREIIGMEITHCGTSLQAILRHTNGKESIIAVPVK